MLLLDPTLRLQPPVCNRDARGARMALVALQYVFQALFVQQQAQRLIQAGADGSSVRQSNANLLLSPLAEMDTKPELEIYADEIEASHGATVGQLDENAVFYMRSRGLSDDAARRILTAAFCRAVTDRIADRDLAARIEQLLDEAMPGSEL